MTIAGLAELWLGVAAEQRQLEELALPLTLADAERGDEWASAEEPEGDAGRDTVGRP